MNDFPEYVLFVKQIKFMIKNCFKIVLFVYCFIYRIHKLKVLGIKMVLKSPIIKVCIVQLFLLILSTFKKNKGKKGSYTK